MAKGGAKIIWVHPHFLYWMGGTKYIYEVIKRLKRDFEMTVIVENAIPLAFENYKKIGVKLVSLNKLSSTSASYWLTLPYHIIKDRDSLLRILRKLENQNSLIVSSMFPMNVVVSLLGKKHLQYCFEPFAFFHDPEFIKNFPPLKRHLVELASFLWSWLDVWATKKADKVVTLNNTTARYIKKVYDVTPDISFTGIDTKHFRPFIGQDLKEKYKNKQIIVHSTDYTPVKGTDKMIRIFAETKKIVPSAHLLITSTIKNSKEENNLKTLAKRLGVENFVEFLGFVDYEILPQIYSLASVLVQCSYSERSGTTSMALPVKEAMACGTLAIRFPVKNEDVEDGITGFLVDPRKTKKMVKKIVQVLKMNRKRYNISSVKARNYIVNKYSWENTSNIIKANINALLKR